jgi:hemerythrin-like metal-binding protein
MSTIAWNPDFETRHEQMDDTHREFVDLLGQIEAALADDDATLLASFDALATHTADHFAREDAWMQAHGFAAENCHSTQHKQVLEVVAEVRRLFVDGGKRQYVEQLLPALMQWFSQHSQAADYGLAQILLNPEEAAVPGEAELALEGAGEDAMPAHSGCGSGSCGH